MQEILSSMTLQSQLVYIYGISFFSQLRFTLYFPQSEKVKRILDIWKDGVGVISLHLFHNIAAGEAYCRESSIIDCIGK